MKLEAIDMIGFGLVEGVFSSSEIAHLLRCLPQLNGDAGTRRLLDFEWCCELARDHRLRTLAESLCGDRARAVRAILFDKSPDANWTLGWHQDKKIAVRCDTQDVERYAHWFEAEGVTHVQPPVQILESMVALRLHLDDCGVKNGPLRAIAGSHLDGSRSEPTIAEQDSAQTLTAKAGDVIWMKPLVFHASSKAEQPTHRRVIHIEYCSALLVDGVSWVWEAC